MIEEKKLRIAIVISHPIQHFCPQYVSFTENKRIEFKVFFASSLGYKKYMDVNFGKEISWGNLHLDKFDHLFLNGDAMLQADKNLDAPSLDGELDTYNPDILFTYGYFQKLQRRAKRWAARNKIQIAYISDSEFRHKRNAGKDLLKTLWLRNYFSKINWFLTMGNANEDFYKKFGVSKNKLVRMHYPIDFVAYKSSYKQKELLRNKIRNQFNISENEIVISVVGKLVAWKNQDHIIEAMKLLESEQVYLNLFIIGSGEMEEMWKKKASQLKQSKVHFPGFVSVEDLPAYYAATDLYIHPASMEPHSVAISEAIIMGCPIILSDRCGSYGETDDVQQNKNGYVFEFGNVEDLAQKINLLLADNEKRKGFGEYSHTIAMEFQNMAHYGILDKLIALNKGHVKNNGITLDSTFPKKK